MHKASDCKMRQYGRTYRDTQCKYCHGKHLYFRCPLYRYVRTNECLYCGETDHLSEDCRERVEYDSEEYYLATCYTCGQTDHPGRPCISSTSDSSEDESNNREDKCSNCGECGHWSVNCPNRDRRGNEYGKSEDKCDNCGEPGHLSNNCPGRESSGDKYESSGDKYESSGDKYESSGDEYDSREDKCYSCGATGHRSNYCPFGNRSVQRRTNRSRSRSAEKVKKRY